MDKTVMNVLIIEPNKEPYTKQIPKNLDALRKILGNDIIEVIEYDENALIVYDDSALLDGLPINRYIDNKAIRGNFIITGNDTKTRDFADITQEQIEKYTQQFSLEQEVELEF